MSSESGNSEGPWMPLLQSRPVRNVAARVEEHTDGRVVLYVRQKKPGFLVPPLSWIVPYKRERSAYLDRVGTRLWRMCDGEHTVEDIVEAFRGQYKLTFHESRAAVMGYLKLLTERGVVAIVTQEDT